jgi:hypothetical protein
MSTFPDIIGNAYQRTPLYKTDVTELGSNNFVRYRKWLRQRLLFNLGWDLLSTSDAQTIEAFISTVEGAHFTFDWFDWRSFGWTNVPIAIGDGSTSTFDLPVIGSIDQHFFISGTTPIVGNVIPGAGTGGVDRVNLVAPPGVNVPLTASFTGRRKFLVTFADDGLSFPRQLESGNWQFAAVLQQAK